MINASGIYTTAAKPLKVKEPDSISDEHTVLVFFINQ